MSVWKDEYSQFLKEKIAKLKAIRANYPVGSVDKAVYRGPRPPRVYSLQEKMEMRMGWQPSVVPGAFAFIEYGSVGDVAFTWILTNDGQSVVLEDQLALFPSDALITKVRMMGG